MQSIKFLESMANLRVVLKRATGRTPSAQVARDIAACLQQGRLFFEIAASAPLQVQPLQIYYGMVGFAKAKGHASFLSRVMRVNFRYYR
jgi:ABC-type arginine/histidine transport system permease subunit